MTQEEFNTLLQQAGFKKTELAKLIGITTQSLNNWGHSIEIPKYAEALLKAYAKISLYELRFGLRHVRAYNKRPNQMSKTEKKIYHTLQNTIHYLLKNTKHTLRLYTPQDSYTYTMNIEFNNLIMQVNVYKGEELIFDRAFALNTQSTPHKELIAILLDVLNTLGLHIVHT